MVAKEWELVEVIYGHDVAGIELRRPPHHIRVIRIRNDIALVRAAIHALGQRVRHAEQKVTGEATAPGYLERIVHGVCNIIGFPNGAETLVRPQRVDVLELGLAVGGIYEKVSRIGQCAERRLVDVGLALQMKATAPHIANAEK